MGSLTGCLKKAGSALRAEDKNAILARFNALTEGGTTAAEAALLAVDEQIAAVQALIAAEQGGEQPAMHKDPGEPAEVVTPAVVEDAIRTAVSKTERKPSAMKAQLLAEIDSALPEAPDYSDFDALVKSMGQKDAAAVMMGRGDKAAPAKYSRPTRTFKIEGDGTFTVNNTVRQLLNFRAEVSASKGFADRQPAGGLKERATDTLDRRGTDAAIANMLDEGDFTAATEFAEFKGVKLEDVKLTKVLRDRLDKWQKEQESAKRMAEYQAAQAAGKPAPGSLAAMVAEKEAQAPAAAPEAERHERQGRDEQRPGDPAFPR